MGSSRRRRRREAAKAKLEEQVNFGKLQPEDVYIGKVKLEHHYIEPSNEPQPANLLRLVRSDGERVPREQDAAGFASEAIAGIRQPDRSEEIAPSAPREHSLVAATTNSITDRIPVSLVRRSFDAKEINAIFNDPSVFPMLALPGSASIDVAPLVADERNVFLIAEGGVISFAWHDVNTYQVHTGFKKGFRGSNAIRASRAAYRWMFTHTDCFELLTLVPGNNPAAALFCRLVGATFEFERKAIWPTPDGDVGVSFWSFRYDDWIRKTPELMLSGREFHSRLEAEFSRHDRWEEQHADEDCHDLHVGACAEMIYAGQLDKAISLYNRWARFAGYGELALISRSPAVIDIGNALLQIAEDSFKVILVR